MSRLSRCTRACQEAEGLECDCSCLGAFHGENSSSWFERSGDVLVDDRGEITRTAVVYVGRNSDDAAPEVYEGQLSGRRYRVDRADRQGWPVASRFMCSGCMSAGARVWDHCHVHGFVRAPLCNTCNTRYWGWVAPAAWPARAEPQPRYQLLPLVSRVRRRAPRTVQRMSAVQGCLFRRGGPYPTATATIAGGPCTCASPHGALLRRRR